MAVQPEVFADISFDAVPSDGAADFFGHGDAQTGPLGATRSEIGDKIPVLNAFPRSGQAEKVRAFQQPVRFGEGKGSQRSNSEWGPDQADSRFLPLARRRLMIRRPPLVDIRFRNPWARARLILLGWYVLFIINTP